METANQQYIYNLVPLDNQTNTTDAPNNDQILSIFRYYGRKIKTLYEEISTATASVEDPNFETTWEIRKQNMEAAFDKWTGRKMGN